MAVSARNGSIVMERTVPSTGSEEIELYQRTYYSLLRSSAQVRIRTLEEAHAGMNSLLHRLAREPALDVSAFVYSVLRLPSCMPEVQLVVLGQSAEVFARAGYLGLNSDSKDDQWQEVFAPARRRRCYFDARNSAEGNGVLACFISSRTDIDDVVPLLTAYQIERNKLHQKLKNLPASLSLEDLNATEAGRSRLAEILEISTEDLSRLYQLWDDKFAEQLGKVAASPCDLRLQLLSGSFIEYRRATTEWWENIEQVLPALRDRPVYFVSSNTHSMLNILSGLAFMLQEELVGFMQSPAHVDLMEEWQKIQEGGIQASLENLLYYLLKKYQQSPEGRSSLQQKQALEQQIGIRHTASQRSFDIEAQVFELSRLNPRAFDPRLRQKGSDGEEILFEWLGESDALILNIDYPLGLTAYEILAEVSSQVGQVLGVYIMGKAATLNAVVGDAMISNVVHDEHSSNTYLFPNCFSSADVVPDLKYGTVLDNQKIVTVQGTFLQNVDYMDIFYREGYTVIEMEAGPYLSAVYEMYRPKRHPVNEIINLYGLPFDLGIVHYASDTPLGKGKNLGAGNLSYYGMDSTYAVTLAILRRIFSKERQRIQNQRSPRG
jgi:hypothetical protein